MAKLELFIKKLNQYIPLRSFGLLSILFGIFGDIIAYSMYPGYNITKNAVSALCDGPGWFFFQTGIIFSGVFAFFWAVYLGYIFNGEEVGEKLKKISIPLAIISCISFIFIGIFCGKNIIVAYIHGTSAIISWGFGFCYITVYNILIIRDSKFSKSIGYFGFVVSFIIATLMVAFFLHLIPALRSLMIILPSLEWINTFAVILWYCIASMYMVIKKI
ncbi:MAG: hypothetical protein KGD65_05000 [Candidatus Lokiarchaeota archaeon]|nr:hypothetical protein [Candidatus Lokiarchaeota archaeon]